MSQELPEFRRAYNAAMVLLSKRLNPGAPPIISQHYDGEFPVAHVVSLVELPVAGSVDGPLEMIERDGFGHTRAVRFRPRHAAALAAHTEAFARLKKAFAAEWQIYTGGKRLARELDQVDQIFGDSPTW